MKKYCATITGIGEDALRLIDNGLCIIFNNNAPPELAELSILHTVETLQDEVKVGDKLTMGGYTYDVLQVGSEANHTLRELGHCTMWLFDKNNGDKQKDCLPGYIVVDAHHKPTPAIGQTIEIDG